MKINKENQKTHFKRKANEIIVFDLYFNIVNRIQVSSKEGKSEIDINEENKIIILITSFMRKKRIFKITFIKNRNLI